MGGVVVGGVVVGDGLCVASREGDALRLTGEIDVSNAESLCMRVVAEVRDGARVLDMSAVGFFAVAGIQVVYAAMAVARRHGESLRLVCSPCVARVMELTEALDAAADPALSMAGPR